MTQMAAVAALPATLRTTNYVGTSAHGGEEAAEDEQTVHRRSVPDENDVVFDIAYKPKASGGFERSVAKYKLFRRTRAATDAIERRQKLERFGAPKGAQGMERGVSMVSHDEVTIEDPLSEDANKTGEERMIEKIKATVKNKGAHRAEQEAAYDYDTYVSSRSSATSGAVAAQVDFGAMVLVEAEQVAGLAGRDLLLRALGMGRVHLQDGTGLAILRTLAMEVVLAGTVAAVAAGQTHDTMAGKSMARTSMVHL
ncbi:Hypothetical Protein FCC1311_036012 [Hondaea fermentalgiana]|uniref:Uncharacterized protein n=1 Tax=Hondaea fermentalgiana TaxID=2315210 RepID=A0A2R5GAP2_9STRA|nr:Hypothetical Protein FCC1311_036012 [Hondaea fermentalgiana]|eukprot:GBG27379.1 Hypothetical Protein FCC1311_036012 [Hondaea fermentalgiana]